MLRVTLSAEDGLALVTDGILARDVPNNGWSVFGALDVSTRQHSWDVVTLAPIGMEGWSSRVLANKVMRPVGQCYGCGASCQTWMGGRNYCAEEYCVHCWHEFFKSRYADADA